MKSFVNILKEYNELVSLLDDSRNYFCFTTKNGRRMIVKIEDKKRCIAVNWQFRAVSFRNKDAETFYSTPLELITSYFEHDSVDITDILITMDKAEALTYLQEIMEVSK